MSALLSYAFYTQKCSEHSVAVYADQLLNLDKYRTVGVAMFL